MSADFTAGKVTAEYASHGWKGKVQLVVHGSGWTFTDQLVITDIEAREKFVKALSAKHPDVDRHSVGQEIDRVEAEVAKQVLAGPGSSSGAEGETGQADGAGGTDCELLVQIVTKLKKVELFHAGKKHDAAAYATIEYSDRREHLPVRSGAFSYWLRSEFFEICGAAPSAQGLNDAISTIEAIAVTKGPEDRVFLRIAEHGGDIYLDLADESWGAIKMTKSGWVYVDGLHVPVRFIRRRGMEALPMPERGGSIEELRQFVNCPSDELWILYAGSLPSFFRPRGPYLALAISGEQGSAKSSNVKKTRALIDPNVAPTRRLPRDDRDLMIAAGNSFVQSFDNLSTISPNISDALCSLLTGAGYSTRALFTDDEEKLINVARPVILNGIEDVATKPDLLDRALVLHLPSIPEDLRREEQELDAAFERARPRILGALLDAVSTALRRFDTVVLRRKPRMVDVARWCQAAETSFGWPEGTFMKAYMCNRDDAVEIAIEAAATGPAILELMERTPSWSSTATALLSELSRLAGDQTTGLKDWPKTGKGMTDALKRLAPALRTLGIEVELGIRGPGRKRERLVVLRRTAQPGEDSGRTEDARPQDGGEVPDPPREVGGGSTTAESPDGADGADTGVATDHGQSRGPSRAEDWAGGARHTQNADSPCGDEGAQVSAASAASAPPPSPCRACAGTRWWRCRGSVTEWICSKCQPPFAGLDVEVRDA